MISKKKLLLWSTISSILQIDIIVYFELDNFEKSKE